MEEKATTNILDAKFLPEASFSSTLIPKEKRKSNNNSTLILMLLALGLCLVALLFLWMPDQQLMLRQRHTIQRLANIMESQHEQMERLRAQIQSLNELLKEGRSSSNLLPDSDPSDLSDPCLLKVDSGPCTASVSRFYFDFDSASCREFEFGGCGGNANNFDTLVQCQSTCELREDVDLDDDEDAFEASSEGNVNPICMKRAEIGRCRGRVERWYFDNESKECKTFFWGGCGGNENNFATRQKCRDTCKIEIDSRNNDNENKDEGVNNDRCAMRAEPGPCRAFFQRYYYDSSKGSCEEFVYGGCDGNANNFETIEECRDACTKN